MLCTIIKKRIHTQAHKLTQTHKSVQRQRGKEKNLRKNNSKNSTFPTIRMVKPTPRHMSWLCIHFYEITHIYVHRKTVRTRNRFEMIWQLWKFLFVSHYAFSTTPQSGFIIVLFSCFSFFKITLHQRKQWCFFSLLLLLSVNLISNNRALEKLRVHSMLICDEFVAKIVANGRLNTNNMIMMSFKLIRVEQSKIMMMDANI